MSIGQTRFDELKKNYQDFIFDDVKIDIVCRLNTEFGYEHFKSTMFHIKKDPEKCLLHRFNEYSEVYGDSYCALTIHKEYNKKRVVRIEFFQ